MCLPHDPLSLLRWMETQIVVLGAWRDEVAAAAPGDAARLNDLERCRGALARECARLRGDLGLIAAFPCARSAANDDARRDGNRRV